MCNDSRNDYPLDLGTCPMCGRTFPIEGRSIYCGPTCRQRAFRLRHRRLNRPTLAELGDMLRRERRLIAQTVYECPSCQERFLGERRCGDCNLMCRKVGLGGECGGCAEGVTIGEILDLDFEGGDTAA
jgi:hypothetical protein